MRTHVLVLLFFLLGSAAQFAQTPRAVARAGGGTIAAGKPLIGPVRREHVADGCGCTYSLKGDTKSTVYSDDFEGTVWMNIEGQDVKLKLISSVTVPKGEPRKGQRATSRYTAPGVKVRVDTVVERARGSDVDDYVGTITVTNGSREQTVRVVGSCRC